MGATRTQSPAQIARVYYAIAGIYTLSASLIWGINTLFLLRVGHLTLLQVFLANAVFTGSMALFEVPTGVVADTTGRRLSFLLSVTILFGGTLAYVAVPAMGGGFVAFCLISVVLGLGYTFYSGAVEAWVVDALNAAGYNEPLDGVMAHGQLISSGAMLVGTVGGGVLANASLVAPYLLRSVLLLAAFVLAYLTMRDRGFVRRPLRLRSVPAEMRRIARESIHFGWRSPRARAAILAGAVPAVFLEWGYHAWQPHFLHLLGMDAVWVTGMIAAAISLAMMAGNWLVERLTRYCGRRTTMLIWAAVVYSISAIGVGLARGFWTALILYLIGMLSMGVFQPVRQGYLHLVAGKEQRATVLSLASLVSSAGSMVGQGGLGWLASDSSLARGYVAGGLVCLLAIPFTVWMRRLGGAPDQVVGRVGNYTSCRSLALPDGVTPAGEREIATT